MKSYDQLLLGPLVLENHLVRHLAQLGIRFRLARRPRTGELFPDLAQPAVFVDDRREVGLLSAELTAALRIESDVGARPVGFYLVQPALELVEPVIEAHSPSEAVPAAAAAASSGRRGGSRLPSGASSPLAASASRIEAIATSIIESSGWRVVMPCSQIPGRNSHLIHHRCRCRAPIRRTSYATAAMTGISRIRPTMPTTRI